MLGDLGSISWNEMRRAYGEASDVLDLIRDLGSLEELMRQEAVSELFGIICHRRTLYEAFRRDPRLVRTGITTAA